MLDEQKKIQYVKMITAAWRQEYPIFEERWKLSEKGYQYLQSKQYSQEEIDYYSAQRRPTNVFNIIFNKFNHLLGDVILNDPSQRVIAKAGGTAETAATLEKILDHWHEQNEYRAEMGRTCLAGWNNGGIIYPRWSNEKQIDGSAVYGNESEFNLLWDSRAQHYFGDDARYMMRWRWLGNEDILNEKAWKGSREDLKKLLDTNLEADILYAKEDWAVKNKSDLSFVDKKNNQYMVLEFHEILWEDAEIALDPTTGEASIIDIKDPDRKKLYLMSNPQLQVIEDRAKVKYITTIIPALNYFLDRRKADVQDGTYDFLIYHPYNYGRYLHEFFGIMTPLVGPQDFINDLENRALDSVNRSVNAGVEFCPDAYENSEDLDYAGQPGVKLEKKIKYAGLNTFRQLDGPKNNTGFEKLLNDAVMFVDMMTLTNNEMGRSETTNEPASLFAQRVAQGQIGKALPNYNFNAVKRRLNNKLIRLTQSNLPMNKLMLITEKNTGTPRPLYVNVEFGKQILNNVRIGEYEVSIDDVAMSPMVKMVQNARRENFIQMLTNMFGPQAPFVIEWKTWLENSDLGEMEEQIKKIEQYLAQAGQQQAKMGALSDMNAVLDTVRKNVAVQSEGLPGPDGMDSSQVNNYQQPATSGRKG